MHRSTIATVLILLVAVGLAITAALAANRAKQEQAAATENLWAALAAEAGSDNSPGKKQTLDAVTSAVAIRPSPELRNRAIAALAKTEVRKTHEITLNDIEANHGVFSTDHRWVYVGTPSGTAAKVDVNNGETVQTFAEMKVMRGKGGANKVFLSPAEKYLAMRYEDNSIIVWDIATGQKVFRDRRRTSRSTYRSIDFISGRDNLMAYTNGETGHVCIVDLESRKNVGVFPVDKEARTLSVSRDGKRIGVAAGESLRVLSISGELQKKFQSSAPIVSVQWHPDGHRIVAGREDATVEIFDLREGRSGRTIKVQKKWTHRISLSPTGDLLMTTGWDNLCRFIDFESGALLAELRGEFPHDFHRSGNQIAACSQKKVAIFEIDRSPFYRPLGERGLGGETFNAIAISPDNRLLAGGDESSLNLWNVETGQLLHHERSGDLSGAAFSRDGRWLVTVTGSGRTTKRLLNPHPAGQASGFGPPVEIGSLGFTGPATGGGNGKFLSIPAASGGWLIDLAGEPALIKSKADLEAGGVCSFVISPDEKFIAYSGWWDREFQVWEHKTGKLLASLPGLCGGLQFSPDSRTLAAINKDEITFWNTSNWTLKTRLERPSDASSYLVGLDWSPDGSLIALGGEGGTVRIIDGRNNHRILTTLRNPVGDQIKRVTFNNDGTRIFTGGVSGLCHLWKLDLLEKELSARGLHWDQSGETSPMEASLNNRTVWFAGIGAIAAVVFGLLTMRHHRNLGLRFQSAESLAREKADELRKAEQQLMQSQKMEALGNLSAGIAHDFRNLLSVVGMSSELIAEDCRDRDDVLEETEQIQKAVRQGDDIVKSMLGFSRGGEDNSPVNVSPVVEELITMLGQQFLSGITLDLRLPRNAPEVLISRSALEQCLLNLVVNASDAMGRHGRLQIECSEFESREDHIEILPPKPSPHGHLGLSISDDGPGISCEKAHRIFEPFFSSKTPGTRGGTGLGLSMVYRIASTWGVGILLAPNQEKNTAGAIFTLVLPVAQTDAAQHSRSSSKTKSDIKIVAKT